MGVLRKEQLTKNFRLSEFQSKDGAEMPDEVYDNIVRLAEELQVIRDIVKLPIRINSAYRSPEHNRKVGGVYNSQHLLGTAADLVIVGLSSSKAYLIIDKLQHSGHILTGGLGLYRTFVHYDIRGRRNRWNKL